jgi:hypothetical protein
MKVEQDGLAARLWGCLENNAGDAWARKHYIDA